MMRKLIYAVAAISSSLLIGCSYEFRGTNKSEPQGPYHKGQTVTLTTRCVYIEFFLGAGYYYYGVSPTVDSSSYGLNVSAFTKHGRDDTDSASNVSQTANITIDNVSNKLLLLCRGGLSTKGNPAEIMFPVFEDLHLASSSSSLLTDDVAFITASILPDAEFESNRPSTIVFSLPESQQYVDFVNNESSCVIAKNQTSCRVAVRAKDVTGVVSQPIHANGVKMFESSVTLQISAVPTESMYIFVTNGYYDGNLGGFAGADAKCNVDTMITQNPSKLGGGKVFKALLNGNNATISGATYKNINDQTIAVATVGNLVGENAAITNAMSSTSFSYAWTGMGSSSVIATNCSNWTSTSGTGTVGYSSAASQSWSVSSSGPTVSCSGANQTLYCVEQP